MSIKVAFFDCDGTLTKVKSSWEYIHRRLDIWDNNADEYQRLFRAGDIDYAEFCRRDAMLWRGLLLSQVMEIIDEIPYQNGVREVVKSLQEMGIYTVILSTGLSLLVDKVHDDLNFHRSFSNDLVSEDGVLTGEARVNIAYNEKGVFVRNVLSEMGFDAREACAIGDGEGDREMFRAVGLPIGFHPDDTVTPVLKHTIFNGSLHGIVDIIRSYGGQHGD